MAAKVRAARSQLGVGGGAPSAAPPTLPSAASMHMPTPPPTPSASAVPRGHGRGEEGGVGGGEGPAEGDRRWALAGEYGGGGRLGGSGVKREEGNFFFLK